MNVLGAWQLDLKLGLRLLVKYPGLTLAGGMGIAVAVALATGAFSLIHGAYAPLGVPLEDGERLVSIELWDTAARRPESRMLYDFAQWREQLKAVGELGASRSLTQNLMLPGVRPESVRVAAITSVGFGVARVRPLLGRGISAQDEVAGAPAVTVISEDLWRNRLGADPRVLERTIQLGSMPHAIVGVMPKGFAFPFQEQIWVPLRNAANVAGPLSGAAVNVFGRLAPGMTLGQAQAELTALGQRQAQAYPKKYARIQPVVLPYVYPFVGLHRLEEAGGLMGMQVLMVSLLLLVSLNVAILVYTRTAMRQAEIGLRTALGASRWRIVGQLVAEAFALCAVSAVVGLGMAAVALWQLEKVTQPLKAQLPFWARFELLPEAFGYAGALTLFATAIVGVLPAVKATRVEGNGGFRVAGMEGLRLGKTWTVLIVAQVGFAVALLPPAVASAWQDSRDGMAGFGFAAEEFVVAEVGRDNDGEKLGGQLRELRRRLEGDGRVASVTFAMTLPGNEEGARVEVEGGRSGEVRVNKVDASFFRVFGVSVLSGRDFVAADGATVVVNQSFAQGLGGGNVVGRRVRYGATERWYEVVGVVKDFPTGVNPGMRDPNQARLYHAVAMGQMELAMLFVRGRTGATGVMQLVRETANAVDADLYLRELRGLDEALRSEQWISRTTAAAFVAITLSVMLLSSAGIYALMSFTVAQRRREIGIRMALGANWSEIVKSIFARALGQLAMGAGAGLMLGMVVERLSDGVVMRGNAAVVLPVVAVVVVAVGLGAVLGPTRRSLQIEPTEALRER
jgi:putative ABC transport system permease protein